VSDLLYLGRFLALSFELEEYGASIRTEELSIAAPSHTEGTGHRDFRHVAARPLPVTLLDEAAFRVLLRSRHVFLHSDK
jgi:carbamate kinase